MKKEYFQTDRLEIVLKYLKEEKGLNQGQVADSIGLTGAAITRMLKGKLPISSKTALLFEHIHNISYQWFEVGEGKMILESGVTSSRSMKSDAKAILLQKLEKRKNVSKLIESLLELSDNQISAIRKIVESYDK
ncbi:helix-turn-helix transcriptional regulator [Leptospira sp. 201903070]|uniref:Helix-turn-helix transcriptional regulator n=1 Tax=Leptospira ainlahdjerensis TaxID=2810033 RepID=A0ABS2UE57_9LEPT|nr:helix-turn-helix transcriptional regulator [Leptospira ainlahdjerensis]MBM9578628.1 helix-turn-helix transcriptional regulator [Leptospira ainlahdjerensis]